MEGYAANNSFNGVALIVKKGNVLLSKGYGYRDMEQKLPHVANTIFPIGSLTEQLTTEMILSLDSKAALSLEDKVYKYFPEIPYSERISIKNLLTHTSGLADYTIDSILLKTGKKKQPGRKEILEWLTTKPLAFYPGTKYAYSATDYFIAGLIVEKVARWGYTDLVHDKICKVCGMRQSGYDFANLVDDNKAVGYYSIGAKTVRAPLTDTAISYSSFGAYSTTGDLYKFYVALRQHKMLPQDWQDLAFTPLKDQAALGWKVETIYNKKFMVHESTIPGYTAMELWQQQDDVFIVLLQNNMNPPVPLTTVADGILKAIYGIEPKKIAEKKETIEKKEGDQPKEPKHYLEKYAGEFEFTPEFSLKFYLQDNQLFAESPTMKAILMVAEGPNTFRTTGVAAKVEFVKDKSGKINKAILHQGGEKTPGERVK
ncbi:MAG: serine hydrolase [Flavipsychrobacter sp.]|nr:serine hydrolase [Flavipsychrobacter sp.]